MTTYSYTLIVNDSECIALKAICAKLRLDPRIACEKLRLAAREVKKFQS
jgi:hypothetical protein